MRKLAFAAVASVILYIASAHASGAIDLDGPGNLDAVERDHPDHFAKIQRILSEVPLQPPNEHSVASWMRTRFQARNVRYTDLVMTSLPPKKRLEFALDDISYVKVVALEWRAKITPAVK